MRKNLIQFLLATFLMICCGGTILYAQTTVKGKVVDGSTQEPLIGAAIMPIGTTQGTVTDIDGNFVLKVSSSNFTLEFKYLGYNNVQKKITKSGIVDMGIISMEPDAIGLDEVSIIASIVRPDRHTPVPVSNIKMATIEEKLSNQEFPELLKSTPSVYVTKESGGYGDSRINVRGFDSSNLGVLINGVPINGMENGRVYWSNWSGLSDVTQFIQVQRGLGASKLGISSIGGTMNMVTKGTETKQGGSAYVGIGNDGYRKYSFTVSTGMMENGWSVTLSGALNKGDGYVQGTNFEGWSYFANISKKINASHSLSLTAFGAPQWHNQRGVKHFIEDYKNSEVGGRLNNTYGILNGEVTGSGYGYNYYHKPQISLNHYWTINEKSTLSTSLYGSLARGGGRRVRGKESNWLSINQYTGRPYEETKMTATGLLDYDAVMAENAVSSNGSQAIFTNSVNSHDWYGVLTSYRNEIFDGFTFTGGFDGRYYKGYHTEYIDNLLGGEYYIESSPLNYHSKNQHLKVGDKTQFDSTGEIIWAGIFAQGEYVKDNLSGFLSLSLTEESFRYGDKGNAPIDGKNKSDFKNFLPWSVKGGLSYKLADYHSVFVNGGYFTRAPFFNSVFANNTIVPLDGVPYEKIGTFELGYKFNNEWFDLSLNGYYTKWMDKSMKRTINKESVNITGLNALHWGIEFEGTYRPVRSFEIRGMFSWGDWKWLDNVSYRMYDENNKVIGEYDAYLKDVHVGNSAQMTASAGISWNVFKNLKVNADFNYAGKNYSDFDTANRTTKEDEGVDAWKIPDFYTIDLGMSYRFDIAKGVKAQIFGNINNLTNREYISDAKDGTNHDMQSALVFYGTGITWSTGIKVSF